MDGERVWENDAWMWVSVSFFLSFYTQPPEDAAGCAPAEQMNFRAALDGMHRDLSAKASGQVLVRETEINLSSGLCRFCPTGNCGTHGRGLANYARNARDLSLSR